MKHLLLLLIFCSGSTIAQNTITLSGKILNEQNEGVGGVNVQLLNSGVSSQSNSDGTYSLKIPQKFKEFEVAYSLAGFVKEIVYIKVDNQFFISKNIVLIKDINQLDAVTINSSNGNQATLQTLNQNQIQNFPSASGNFESLLKTLPGVSSNNELSSQYSVRGGNFDENLIYINEIEIFRPLLIRNGQQEGLSFINPELVSKASFSAGGFEAKYGEKLSSVLDIRYYRPDSSQITTSVGLLGLSASIKMLSKKAYFLAGARTKANQNLLKTQQTKGAYQPKFYDLQALYNIDLNKKFTLSTFVYYNSSRFNLVPESRETVLGTLGQQYRLNVKYQGQERDQYESLAGALTLTYKPSQNLWFKWLNSGFLNKEQETFDIEGSYIFDELTSSNGFENVRINRGIGVNYDYARNTLDASIYSSELKSYYQKGRSFWESGIRYQYDNIKDHLHEYQVIDSAGYTLPNNSEKLILTDVVNAENNVTTHRYTAFVQNTLNLTPQLTLAAGLRSNYNSFTEEFLVSPRFSAVYKPTESNRVWRFAAGSYNQPPFYRELRNFDGSLNYRAKSQRSIHLLAATDYFIKKPNSVLKFTSEIYFKHLNNLVPYKIENLRVRYFADQQSNGYALGADFAVSSEFVPGLESSFRLSLMKTAEDIEGDSYIAKDVNGNATIVHPGYLKRPTDQRINFSAFFQDELFNNPSCKVHLTLLYGSALPVGPHDTQRYHDNFKIPAYKRADIGFSKDFLQGRTKVKLKPLSRYFDSFIAYAEVFNLLNINNTVSFLWIKDVNNNQFAIPNYLTSRQLNIKFIAKFKN